jgi:hypothetical protein
MGEIKEIALRHDKTLSATIEGLLLKYGLPGYRAARSKGKAPKPKAPKVRQVKESISLKDVKVSDVDDRED